MTGRIVDLGEQKVYDLDMKKKTYTVTTFEQLRQKLREAQERAAKEAKDAPKEAGEPAQPSGDDKQVEFDFDVKETGQTRSIAGYDAKQVIMTVTVREKGKTLDESGGVVLTADSWLGPDIPCDEGAGRVRDEVLEGRSRPKPHWCRPSRWRPSPRCIR